ncbi:hypothetical protein GGG16DRAFT_111511 [Schizophyllum commune]
MSAFSQLLPLIAAFYGFLWLYMRQKRKEEWAEIRANMRRNGIEMDEFGRLVDRDGMPLLDAEGRMMDVTTGLGIGPQATDQENAETIA